MTRSTIRFFHGDFFGALRWNPLIFLALCGLVIFDVYAFAVLVLRAPRLRLMQFSPREKTLLRVLVIVLLLANWLYLLSRPAAIF
jgi:type II secretory pathway component PulM